MSLSPPQRVVLLVTMVGLTAMATANNVLSQLGAFTARDPGVRTGVQAQGGCCPIFRRCNNKYSA